MRWFFCMVPGDAPAGDPSRVNRIALVLALAVLCLVADLWTKAWAWDTLRNKPGIKVIEGLLHFEFGFNTGSAFGLLRDHSWARAFFIVVTLLALTYMVRMALTLPRRYPSAFVAVGLIMGGALGNLHDRVFRTMNVFGQGTRHGVVDFIVVFYWPDRRWPAFNIADAALVAGVLLFMIFLRRHGQTEPPTALLTDELVPAPVAPAFVAPPTSPDEPQPEPEPSPPVATPEPEPSPG